METQMEDEDVVMEVVEVMVGMVVVMVCMTVAHWNEVAHQHGLLQMPMMIPSPSHLLRALRTLTTHSSYLIMN